MMKRITINTNDQNARVVPFRRRNGADIRHGSESPIGPAGREPLTTGLERYERPDGTDDDYRHRMLVNVAALAVCLLLGAAGIWVAISIADLRRNQDCVLAGRKNCAGLSIPSGAGLIGEDQAASKRILTK